jgi:hypothetical protein
MKKLFISFMIVAAISIAAFAQNVKPTPPAGEDVVKITTNLIQVDVTVTDKNGKVVQGLSPDDFEIFENGERQNISNFVFVTSILKESTIAGSDPAAAPGSEAGVQGSPVTRLTRAKVGRTIALRECLSHTCGVEKIR